MHSGQESMADSQVSIDIALSRNHTLFLDIDASRLVSFHDLNTDSENSAELRRRHKKDPENGSAWLDLDSVGFLTFHVEDSNKDTEDASMARLKFDLELVDHGYG